MKSVAAAAATPLVPAALASPAVAAPATYAKALAIAKNGAFLSDKYLEFRLGVTASTSKALVRQLTANGVLGTSGMGGVMISKSYLAANAPIVMKAASSSAKAASASEGVVDRAKALGEEMLAPEEDAADIALDGDIDTPDGDADTATGA